MSWRKSRRRLWIDLTPLIDVVFTLLLFVIVTAQFTSEAALPLNLPKAAQGASVSGPIVVSVSAQGVFLGKTPSSESEIGPAVALLTAKTVVVRAEGSVPYERVFAVLSSLERAGVADVGLAYEPLP